MKVKRAKIMVTSALAVLGTLTVAVAVNVRSRMQVEVIPPKGGVFAPILRSGEEISAGKATVKDGHVLLAEADKPTFASGEPIILKLILANHTNKPIYVIDSSSIRDHEFEIKRATGERMSLSERGRKSLESPPLRTIVSRIDPRQVVQTKLNLGDLYDLSPAAYTVIVKRKISMQDRKKFVELESNPVKVVVKP